MTGNELCTCGHRLKEHDGEDFDCLCGCEYFFQASPALSLVDTTPEPGRGVSSDHASPTQ